MRAGCIAFVLFMISCGSRERFVMAPMTNQSALTSLSPEPSLDGGVPPSAPESNPFVGRWNGLGMQNDGQSWEMQVEITGDRGKCAKVRYPSVPCAAEWICTDVNGGILTATERLTEGQNRCIDGGKLTLTLTGDYGAEWSWAKDASWAHATLKKEMKNRRK